MHIFDQLLKSTIRDEIKDGFDYTNLKNSTQGRVLGALLQAGGFVGIRPKVMLFVAQESKLFISRFMPDDTARNPVAIIANKSDLVSLVAHRLSESPLYTPCARRLDGKVIYTRTIVRDIPFSPEQIQRLAVNKGTPYLIAN